MNTSIRGTEIQGVTFFAVRQIAMLLKTWPDEINVYIKNGELKSQVINKEILISESELQAFLRTHRFPAMYIGGDNF